MKELTLNGKTFLTTKRAAEITGYTTDYVGQLARQAKVEAQLVGRNWYIGEESISKHKFGEAKVSIKKEEEERHSPALEVLVTSAGETLNEKEEEEVSQQQEVLINKEEEVEEGAVLDEMQGAWQEWYKAQRSVPVEEEEVFLSKEDKEEEKVSAVQEVPIAKVSMPIQEEVLLEEDVQTEEPVVSTLPAQRSWAGTGLALAAVGALMFVGVLTLATGYVLTKGTGSPVASVYQGVGDYILGVQRFESK